MTRHIACLGLGLGSALGAVGPGAAAQARPAPIIRIEQRWPFAADGSVRIVNPAGRIRVIGWDVDTVAVRARGAGAFAADGNGSVRKLVVTGRADLEVHLPRGARVWVKSAAADIDVVGVDGTLELNSVSGAIHLRVPGTTVADFDLLTIGGSIANGLTSDAPQRGTLRFSTGAGGAQVTIRSFKGSISLEAK